MHLHHRFNPELAETELDRSVRSLLGVAGSNISPAVHFGDPTCPPDGVFIPSLESCWSFDCGAIKAIERLSQGTSNVWRVGWTCDQISAKTPLQPGATSYSIEERRRPWRIDDPEGGLFVFPTGMGITIGAGESALRIPVGTMFGRQMFFPKGMKSFVPGNRSYAITRVFDGYRLVEDCIAQAETRGLTAPAYLVGDASDRRMVVLLQRFGFQVIGSYGIMTSLLAPWATVLERAHDYHDRVSRIDDRARRNSNRE